MTFKQVLTASGCMTQRFSQILAELIFKDPVISCIAQYIPAF